MFPVFSPTCPPPYTSAQPMKEVGTQTKTLTSNVYLIVITLGLFIITVKLKFDLLFLYSSCLNLL